MVNVSDGYALNYLIPRGLAETATPTKEKEIEKRKEEERVKREARTEEVSKGIVDLKGEPVLIEVKANDKGKLFAGLEKKHLISALKDRFNIDLDQSDLVLEEPIKEVGEHKVIVFPGEKDLELMFSVKAKE